MPKIFVAVLLSLSCTIPAWAQNTLAGKPKPPPFRPTVELADVWRMEPTDFLGIVPGKPVSEQTAVAECRMRVVPSTGERVLDKDYAHFCTTNAPFYSSFRNKPDLGFPYEVNFLMRKKVVEGVQLTVPRAHLHHAFEYITRAYGQPTSTQLVKARDVGDVLHDVMVYSWAGTNVFMSLTEFSPTTGHSTIALSTNQYIDDRAEAAKNARR